MFGMLIKSENKNWSMKTGKKVNPGSSEPGDHIPTSGLDF